MPMIFTKNAWDVETLWDAKEKTLKNSVEVSEKTVQKIM
jgi:hypothetical protein